MTVETLQLLEQQARDQIIAFLDACVEEMQEGLQSGLSQDEALERFNERIDNSVAADTCEEACYKAYAVCLQTQPDSICSPAKQHCLDACHSAREPFV